MINGNYQNLSGEEILHTEFMLKNLFKKYQKIINQLLPLHLSLQAFWGISLIKNEKLLDDNGFEFVSFGKRKNEDKNQSELLKKIYDNEIRKKLTEAREEEIGSDFAELFPNTEAFLLVEDATFDFYSPTINLVLNKEQTGLSKAFTPNSHEEQEAYKTKSLFEILDNINELNDFKEKLQKEVKKSFNEVRNIRLEDNKWKYDHKEFVTCLRELYAILANTCPECKENNQYYGYKGEEQKERDSILKVLNISEKHCKISDKNDKPTNNYNILVNQLIDWGIGKAIVVIAGIEEFAKVLMGNEK